MNNGITVLNVYLYLQKENSTRPVVVEAASAVEDPGQAPRAGVRHRGRVGRRGRGGGRGQRLRGRWTEACGKGRILLKEKIM